MAFKTLESKETTGRVSVDREEELGKEAKKWMRGEGEGALRCGVQELKRRKWISRHAM